MTGTELDATCTETTLHVHVIGYRSGDATAPRAHRVVTDGAWFQVRDRIAQGCRSVDMWRVSGAGKHVRM